MNFFEHQARARRRTRLLVIPFVVAVVAIVLALNVVAWLVYQFSGTDPAAIGATSWMDLPYWPWITLGTVLIIAAGSLKTSLQLAGGGTALAKMLGARQIAMDSSEAAERRLINVVEEMSIASGTPVPRLYVLDQEPSINAFVAGLRPTETVLVVTRGALDNFTRDELQGVIGHEYSHIFNGDMRLNMRLMGVLAGILLIGQIGRFIMRSGNRGRGKGSGQMVLAGLAMFIVGYVGLFCGALIKAAVSRQREYLADASAVQFTRNPDGIASALYRILEHAEGSLLRNAHADDVSHFCIGESVRTGFTSLLATHPPIRKRIQAIDPAYFARRDGAAVPAMRGHTEEVPAPSGALGFAGTGMLGGAQVADTVGAPRAVHHVQAEAFHAALPDSLAGALHDRSTVAAAAYALLLTGMDAQDRVPGIALLRARAGDAAASGAAALVPAVLAQGRGMRLAILNMALPTLKVLSPADRQRFLAAASDLIQVDGRTTAFEFAALVILRQHLADDAGRSIPVRHFSYAPVLAPIRVLLGTLAHAGGGDATTTAAAFRLAMAQFQKDPGTPQPGNVPSLEKALTDLAQLAPLLKQALVQACADCVIHDGRVAPAEAELLQAVAVALDCPMPPLVG